MYKVCGCTLPLNDPTVCERCGAKCFGGVAGYSNQPKKTEILLSPGTVNKDREQRNGIESVKKWLTGYQATK